MSASKPITRDDCIARDAADPLRGLKSQFALPAGVVYLDGMHSPRDIRVFVVDGKVMGAIYRVAPSGQWITNLARGGRAEPCPITAELQDLAISASRAVGAVYCGVDLLETDAGLTVIEVNATPFR